MELISTKRLHAGKSRRERSEEEKRASYPAVLRLPLLYPSLFSRGSSSIPEIGQKSNRVANVNGNVGVVDPDRRGIQQICSLTSELARSDSFEGGKDDLDDAARNKKIRSTVCAPHSYRGIDFLSSPKLNFVV